MWHSTLKAYQDLQAAIEAYRLSLASEDMPHTLSWWAGFDDAMNDEEPKSGGYYMTAYSLGYSAAKKLEGIAALDASNN